MCERVKWDVREMRERYIKRGELKCRERKSKEVNRERECVCEREAKKERGQERER